MTFGEVIKKLRNQKQLSQPMLADAAAIEQSYLSKLENDKSLPSNDVFKRLLNALEIELRTFLNHFSRETIHNHLVQIPDVQIWLQSQKQQAQLNSRRWLLVSSALIVLAVTLFYSGYNKLLFSEHLYHYKSEGIVLSGEPYDYFEGGWRLKKGDADLREVRDLKESRYDPAVLSFSYQRPGFFTLDVKGGTRTYFFDSVDEIKHIGHSLLQILGVLLFSAGVMGFITEARLTRKALK